MTTSSFSVRLFYSYSHKDAQYRDAMETALALLKREGVLKQWSDNKILPGHSISAAIEQALQRADIGVFLLSKHFLESEECMKEWRRAQALATGRNRMIRVPVIVGECAWADHLADDDIKVLPEDGKPVTAFSDPDVAWMQVYEGIKSLIDTLRIDLTPRADFLTQLQSTDVVVSQQPSTLDDLFVFLPLSRYSQGKSEIHELDERAIGDADSLLQLGHVLVHGDDMSGKTALARHIILSLIYKGQPALLVDLQEVKKSSNVNNVLAATYHDQFYGDYGVWRSQESRIVVLDNLSSKPASIDFVAAVLAEVSTVIVLASTDTYVSYYRDDIRLAKCSVLQLRPLTHVLQEELIRKRLSLMGSGTVDDGAVDQVERRVNAVINTRILPRYPFYVLSILQTLEAFMPRDMAVTSHGHCYYIFIMARLMNAGISKADEDINVCLNFSEQLAYTIYCSEAEHDEFSRSMFDTFVADYRQKYVLPDSIHYRLIHSEYGILTSDGRFQHPYMYYFFLGRHLATHEHDRIIEQMCQDSHVAGNHLTLLFVIHHATNDKIIDEITLRAMCSLDEIPPARLDPKETKRFQNIVGRLPSDILSGRSVEAERRADRQAIDNRDTGREEHLDERSLSSLNRAIYRILKNNELLGQVLRVRYGRLDKQQIATIAESIADSGLRLVNVLLMNEEDISDLAQYLHARVPDLSERRIKRLLQFTSFLWTMTNVELVVKATSHKEITSIIRDLVRRKRTPAYDIIGFFGALDSADKLTSELRHELKRLLKRHDDSFVRSVLSIRVQHYMNTHRSSAQIEQGVCADLGIRYRHRMLAGR